MARHSSLLFLTSLTLALTACSGAQNEDLQSFMESEMSKRGGRIEPLPDFPPYVSVVYSAAGLRSPFDVPRNVVLRQETGRPSTGPIPNRPREHLERYNIAELSVVGNIVMNNESWALIRDNTGSVHRVRIGMYLGQNHGRIVSIEGTEVSVLEIVPDGQGGWIERPRSVNVR
jgi:type IV pilus assembly protein PilP